MLGGGRRSKQSPKSNPLQDWSTRWRGGRASAFPSCGWVEARFLGRFVEDMGHRVVSAVAIPCHTWCGGSAVEPSGQGRHPSRRRGKCWGLEGVEMLLPEASGCPAVVCFGLFDHKVVCCVFPWFLPVHHLSLRLSRPKNFADRQSEDVPCSVDLLLVTCSGVSVVLPGPSTVSVEFRSVPSWLCCSGGFWLRVCLSHVSGWLKLVEVFVRCSST